MAPARAHLIPLFIAMTASLAMTAPGAAGDAHHATVFTGDGPWTAPDSAPISASAEWSFLGDLLSSYRVTAGDATFACVHGHLIVHHANGTGERGTCLGHVQGTDEARLRAITASGRWNGTFQASGAGPFTAPAEARPAWNALGATVTALAALFLATTLILTIGYVRERRFKDYLVRRLYEETQGRFPYDLPEGERREVYARVLAKGKN